MTIVFLFSHEQEQSLRSRAIGAYESVDYSSVVPQQLFDSGAVVPLSLVN